MRRLVLGLCLLAVAGACGGRSERDDDGNAGKGASGGAGGTGATGGTGGTGGTGCCLAYPTCPEGEVEISGPEECPPELPGSTCHSVSVCCSTIWCATPRGTPTCDPASEHNRDYLGNPSTCTLIDFICADPTFAFYNECGCGCEQDASCPPAFDCGPSGRPAPPASCTPENLARCPLSPVDE